MYFDNCNNLNELKSLYHKLILENHPDLGGNTRTMQEINAEYDRMHEVLKKAQNREAKVNDQVKETTETPEEFRMVVEQLLKLDGIEVELCGAWLWISGATREVKEELKALKCRWSKSKKMWYWRHEEKGCYWSRGSHSMNHIRSKYGSEKLHVTYRKALEA